MSEEKINNLVIGKKKGVTFFFCFYNISNRKKRVYES